jgi:hypothetical protein
LTEIRTGETVGGTIPSPKARSLGRVLIIACDDMLIQAAMTTVAALGGPPVRAQTHRQ